MNDKEKINLINSLIDYWEADTCLLSYTDFKHPAFTLVVKMSKKDYELVVITVLKRMKEKLTWFFCVMMDIVDKKDRPEFPESIRGKIQEITDVWLKWGKNKGYLNDN